MGPDGPVRTKEGSNTAADNIYNFFGSAQASVYNAGYPEVTRAFETWYADAVKYAYKPLFWNLNITVPDQYSKIAARDRAGRRATAVASASSRCRTSRTRSRPGRAAAATR